MRQKPAAQTIGNCVNPTNQSQGTLDKYPSNQLGKLIKPANLEGVSVAQFHLLYSPQLKHAHPDSH